MISIKELRESLDDALDYVQAKAEAAQVQAALGAMELEQRFGDQLEQVSAAASGLKDQLLSLTDGDEGERVRQAADQLRVQVALGAMDSKDTLVSMKSEMEARLAELDAAVDDFAVAAGKEASESIREALSEYSRQAAKMKAEIEARLDSFD